MDTIQVGIESLTRGSVNEPWKMTFLTPGTGIRMTAVLRDGVEVGPRFSEVLTSIERNQVYPRTITGRELELLGMATNDSFTIKMLSNVPAHVEISFRPYRQFMNPSAPKIKGSLTEQTWTLEDILADKVMEDAPAWFSAQQVAHMESGGGGSTFTPVLSDTINDFDYLLVGQVTELIDGDTIDFKIERVGELAAKDDNLAVDNVVRIRFAGVNTPETIEHGEQQGNERNKDYMEAHKVDEATAFEIGKQAWERIEDFLGGDGYVVIDIDADINGRPKIDKYNRYVAAIYKTEFTAPDEPFEGEFSAPQLNKTLLWEKATDIKDLEGKDKTDAPLAIPYLYFIDNEYSRLVPSDWLYEVGIRNRDEERVGEKIKREKEKEQETSNPIEDGTMLEIKTMEERSNAIDFMEPYDDRFEDLFPEGIDHSCRIGDVMLVVPPLAIDANRVSNIRKIKTLRSKSSMLIKGGSSVTTITLQLYFHDLDAINGHRVKASDKDWDRHYYVDGLRPLIAQFKKAPFVPIDNKYINETLGIDSVALVNLNVQTIPGFPHSLAASITLAKFEHTAYMPQLPRLGDGVNYPMFRWYYQEPLRDDLEYYSEYRTWLRKIPDTGLTNDFQFTIVSEEDLITRKQAIENLRQLTNPLIMEERFMNPGTDFGSAGNGTDTYTLLGMLYKDGLAAQRVKDMYNRYLKAVKDGLVSEERDEDNYGFVPSDKRIASYAETTKNGREAFKRIYGDDRTEEKLKKISHFAPFESDLYTDQVYTLEYTGGGTSAGQDQVREKLLWEGDLGGAYKIRLYSPNNIDLFDEEYKAGTDGDLTNFFVPGNQIDILDQIINRGKYAEDQYVAGIQEWDETKAKVEATEANLRLIPYSVSGQLIPTSLSVMYENQFSSAQLQMLDSPTFQFLGGQDPYVQVTFEADEFAIEDLRHMLEETERFSREYRTGITSGFLGVDNHLLQMFGVTTVMPESVNIRTVPGFPGRYEIDMVLCGFNKTQKRMETLEGISPIYGDDVSMANREVGTYSSEADDAIIQVKMAEMELYPDLELPTYDELVAVLPYLDAKCTVFENRAGSKYLDPDFYMATPHTMRNVIRDQRYDNHEMQLSDFMGVQMYTGSGYALPLEGDAAMWDVLNAVDARSERINSNFSWSGDAMNSDSGMSNAEAVTFASTEVEEYVKDRESLKTPPTYEEWKEMLGIEADGYNSGKVYSDWVANKLNPEEWEVYNEIYKLVDEKWVTEGYVYNDSWIDPSDDAWRKITYATNEDLKDLMWNHLVEQDPDLLKDREGKKVHKLDNVEQKDFKATNYLPTREFIANMIKSIIHARSRWQQMHSSGMPILDSNGNACGIGGVPLSSEATDVKTARRLLWDWRYNLQAAVNQLFEGYQAAYRHDELKFKYHPWDWMIAAYERGTIEVTVKEMESPFWHRVHSVHELTYRGWNKLYATPTSQMSMVIMQQKNGWASDQMAIIRGDKEALINELLATGYREKKKDEEQTRKILEKLDAAQVKEKYEDWMFDLYEEMSGYVKEDNGETEETYMVNPYVGLVKMPDTEVGGYDYGDVMEGHITEGDIHAQLYFEYKKAMTYIENTENSRLVQSAQPQDIFPEMFTDIIHFDQRMRLLRAFPTFQMFIVDEGRWMTNYRLWDNLYGFNAIQSIDIHKSRKIAADTAVITMTNVYSNLTSRSLDTTYEEWDYKFWDNLVFGNPNDKLLEARKELQSSLLLQTGARIHLRMGYGSSVTDLPVVFNGTITEMNADEIVQIVAQGDGIELGNVISGDEDDDNKGFFKITEPRDLICQLLTSKGNWFKDAINWTTDGAWFKENPLGIQHFGQPGEKVPEALLWKHLPFAKNHEYGEAAQNIYSSNGIPTYSQWVYADGSDIPWSWDTPILKWLQPGDEENIVVPFYNNTVWDIVQTIAMCSTDYIAAVHPFEMRSTLFFGKPYWRVAYQYDSRYEYSKEQKAWIRHRDVEHRKPYSQFHIFTSEMDIISNKVKASSDGIYTNVIVNYDGKQTPVIYADWDIRFDKHKTTVVDAEIVSRMDGLDFWTSEKQAMYYGASVLRDYMKDMYQGELVVLGDPTIKPHDICFMQDNMYNMHGNVMVKAVTHHFSHETGFVSSIQPDALAVTDDLGLLSVSNWGASFAAKAVSYVAGYFLGARAIKKMIPSSIASKAMALGKAGGMKATHFALAKMADHLPDTDSNARYFKKLAKQLRTMEIDDPKRADLIEDMKQTAEKLEKKLEKWDKNGMFVNEQGVKVKGKGSYARMKRTVASVKSMTNALTDGPKALKLVRMGSMAILGLNPLSLAAAIATTWAVETIAEKYRRKKASMQAVLMMPLMYQGRQYTAGINGHKGMVVGDPMGKMDSFMSGMGLDGINGNNDWEWVMDTWNWLTDAEGKDFMVTQEDLMNGTIQSPDGEGFLSE
jgi:endonuclease YncB( thermonuclease family)